MPVTKGEGKIISFRAEAAAPSGLRGASSSPSGVRGHGSKRKARSRQADVSPAGPLTYPFNKSLLSAHSLPGTVLSTGDEAVTKKAKRKSPHLMELTFIEFHSCLCGVTNTARGAGDAAGSQAKFAHSGSTRPSGHGEKDISGSQESILPILCTRRW